MNRFAADILERATVTFGEAFCAALLLSLVGAPALPSLSLVEKAAGAGVVAVLALLKGVFAGLIGNKDSAAILPATLDGTAPVPPGVPVTVDHNPVPALPTVSAAEAFAGTAYATKPKTSRRARNA